MKILFVTPECAPMVKTGGLGDVSAALPRALKALGHEVVILMPAYGGMAVDGQLEHITAVSESGTWPAAQLLHTTRPDGMAVWLLSCPALYASAVTPYGDPHHTSMHEQALRFGLLSRVAALLGTTASLCQWKADIVHANDWPCGLAPLYLLGARAAGHRDAARCLFTIHNLAFQGVFPMSACDVLDIADAYRGMEGVEYWGQLSMLKAGLQFADAITTVSPTYAREIQQPALGFGLDGVLRSRSHHLHGILNGIDRDIWNPATDTLISTPYTAENLLLKAQNKAALRQRLGLNNSPKPLFGFVGRLTEQKGIDFVLAGAPRLLTQGAQLVVLGRGDGSFETSLSALAAAFPGQVHVALGFDEALAHQIEAGADCFLMPSRFEPCGLNQMYSQAYGSPPLVTCTGGLADTVCDLDGNPEQGTGFVMANATQAAFDLAIDRALAAWAQPARWRAMQVRGMRKDFGWSPSAMRYGALSLELLKMRPARA
jgi:starch synthase